MNLVVHGIPTTDVAALRDGGPDANGQPALVRIAQGLANPCRHCLQLIPEGEEKLVFSYRPFPSIQPYAETGPIFLHKRPCNRYEGKTLPSWFAFLQPAIIRGYDASDWSRYDTGDVVDGKDLAETCRRILSMEGIAFVHIRSKWNCFQCQVDRA